jgi:hypothetical protein
MASFPALPRSPSPFPPHLTNPPPHNHSMREELDTQTNESDLNSCCMICYESYQITGPHEPRVMSCGHTLCYDCLKSLYSSALMRCCPFCKSDLQLTHPNHFPKNFSLIQILQEFCPTQSDSSPRVNRSNRVRLAKMQCAYERAMLEQARSEIIEYDRLKFLAHSQIMEIEHLSREAFDRFHETHQRLERKISIMAMLHSPSDRQSPQLPHPQRSDPQPCPQHFVHCATSPHYPIPLPHNYPPRRYSLQPQPPPPFHPPNRNPPERYHYSPSFPSPPTRWEHCVSQPSSPHTWR